MPFQRWYRDVMYDLRAPSSPPRPFFSIAVAAIGLSEQHLRGFTRLLRSIDRQTFRDFEVIISDQSADDSVARLVASLNLGFSMKIVANSSDRGYARRNLNFAFRHASGEYLKPMDMDDFFSTPDSLALIAQEIRVLGPAWAVVGFDHVSTFHDKPVNPTKPSLSGTLGSPSALVIKNLPFRPIVFHDHLMMINDHSLHQDLLLQYGKPVIVENCFVTIGTGPGRISDFVETERLILEAQYFTLRLRLALSSLLFAKRLLGQDVSGGSSFADFSAHLGARSAPAPEKRLFPRLRTPESKTTYLPLVEVVQNPESGEWRILNHRP